LYTLLLCYHFAINSEPMNEKNLTSISGYTLLVIGLLLIVGAVMFLTRGAVALGVISFLIGGVLLAGLAVINPNEAVVTTFFGDYTGTMRQNGLQWVNPFYTKKKISLRARNLNGQNLKVNDKTGNPIEIAAVVVWQVSDTAKALFEVDDYVLFVQIQSEAAVRYLANSHAYDNNEAELNERLARAGVTILEARISHLAYAPEIAGAMLQRQQASAVVAARRQIVDGAVGMVEMALERLAEKNVVHLDEERKAAMVSNLLVVLCGEKNVSPVVNAGSLY
jgi:regulator of protease activity HflC (stomatin/prohibitin superfamily)